MSALVTDADLQSYREQGYLVVPGLVSPEEVEVLRADTLRVCRGEYPHPNLEPMPDGLTDDEVLRGFLCIHQPHKLSQVMLDRGVRHPGLAGALSRLIGPDVKCMQSMLFVKPPGFQGQAWHQDEIFIPTRDRSLTGWLDRPSDPPSRTAACGCSTGLPPVGPLRPAPPRRSRGVRRRQTRVPTDSRMPALAARIRCWRTGGGESRGTWCSSTATCAPLPEEPDRRTSSAGSW